MTTTTYNTQQNIVKNLRKIRDQISSEIKDMNFEEERAYLNKLLSDDKKSLHNPASCRTTGGADSTQQQQ